MGVSGKGDHAWLPAGPKVQSTCFVPKIKKGGPGQAEASWVLMLQRFTGECSLGEACLRVAIKCPRGWRGS